MTADIPHLHCPRCHVEKPQPIRADGRDYCGRCACVESLAVECVLCTGDVCAMPAAARKDGER